VLSAIAMIPSAPVMVPALAGAAATEVADLGEAVLAAAASLPPRWVAVGVGDADAVIGSEQSGTFAGYGVDVPVRLSPSEEALHDVPAELPLCALITGWVRGQAKPRAHAEVRVYARHHDADAALSRGRRLRAELEQESEPVGVLIVADGVHTLTPPAPGGYDPDGVPVQHALDEALACGDVAALTGLSAAVVGRVAYQVLAGLTEPAPRSAKEFYRGAPYGVGYFAGVWQP
jgi:hypothetical protein